MTEPVPEEGGPRWVPRTIGGAVYLLVVGMMLVGLGVTLVGQWRPGVSWMGSALLLGSAARAVLSERAAGMLRIRRRWSDVVTLVVAGLGLIVLAVVVPEQPL